MNRIFFVVVIYNKNFEKSKTCVYLKKIEKKFRNNIIIFDNSTIENDIETKCNELNWNYISTNCNKGLSVAYNESINFIIKKYKNYKEDIMVLLDDDTNITYKYVEELFNKAIENKNVNIFIPKIISNDGMMISPTKYTPIKNSKIKNMEELNNKNILAINSCLAIRMKIFENYKYDEKLFLDYVDSQFFYDMRNRNEDFCILDCTVVHNFFMKTNKDYRREISRMKILKRDYRNYVKNKKNIEKILYYPRVLYWKIRGVIKYHKLSYFIKI